MAEREGDRDMKNIRKYRRTYIVTDEIVNSLKQAKNRWQAKSITEVLEILIRHGMPEVDRKHAAYQTKRECLEKDINRLEQDIRMAKAKLKELKFS